MIRIKICGITEAAHALAAAEAGADFIGLVFAPSKRQVTLERAREIVLAVTDSGKPPLTVGVFVNAAAPEVNRTADYCGLDWVQLSGDEPWEGLRDIERPVIKAIRVGQKVHSEELNSHLKTGRKLLGKDFICLLDTHVEGSYGGSGQTFDWGLVRDLPERFPVIIAGGLSAENVGQAIKMLRPWGVDVSSGVESKGVKDVAKIKAFIEAVRNTEERGQRTKKR